MWKYVSRRWNCSHYLRSSSPLARLEGHIAANFLLICMWLSCHVWCHCFHGSGAASSLGRTQTLSCAVPHTLPQNNRRWIHFGKSILAAACRQIPDASKLLTTPSLGKKEAQTEYLCGGQYRNQKELDNPPWCKLSCLNSSLRHNAVAVTNAGR